MGLKLPNLGGHSARRSARRGQRTSSPGRPGNARPRIEHLEDRTLLSLIGPIDDTRTSIPIGPVHAGQTIMLRVDFTTTDPNDPREGEPLIIEDSAGEPVATITNYGTKDYPIPITQDNETLYAYIRGGDGDEEATIEVGPTIEDVHASTSDSKSLTVRYTVQGNDDKESFPLNVYRSSSPTPGLGDQVAIAKVVLKDQDATDGAHSIQIVPFGTQNAPFTFLQAHALRPDPTHPYVITTAGDAGLSDPGNTPSSSYSTFRIWLVGAVAHGLDGDSDLAVYDPAHFKAPYLHWVDTMADQLRIIDHYDAAVPFHWEQDSVSPSPGLAVNAGHRLAGQVEQAAAGLALGTNDVVDVNFIGYSRGAVVVSQALLDLESFSPVDALNHGFMMETLVDPHPANNSPTGPTARRITGFSSEDSYLGDKAADFTRTFQNAAADPNVIIPANVQAAADFYQHTLVKDLDISRLQSPHEEPLLNLWGEGPGDITNASDINLNNTSYNKTYLKIGHGEMMFYPNSNGVYEAEAVLSNRTLQALGLRPFVQSLSGDPLVVTTQPPATITAGAPFGFVVTAQNSDGSVNASFNGSVTVSTGIFGGTLGGTTTVSAINGVATFSGLTLTKASTSTQLFLNASGFPSASTGLFTVKAAAASQLAFPSSLGTVLDGASFSVTVQARDPFGNQDTSYNGTVALSLLNNPGGATLAGTLTAGAVNGTVTFNGLTLNAAGAGYTLQATASGLTAGVSTAFTVQDELLVTTQPPSVVTVGVPFTVAVTVEDALGHTISSYNGPVTVADSFGYALGGTKTVNAVGGVATFTGLTLSTATGFNSLTFSATGIRGVVTNSFSVVAAAATKLAVVSFSGSFLVNAPLSVTVDAQDASGNVATTYNGSVTLSLASNPGGATLGGTLTATASNGVATFSGVSISAPGVGYIFQASASGLTSGASSTFTIQDRLAVTTPPPATVTAGAPFTVAVSVEDGLGNVVASYNGPVTVANSFSGPLGGTTTVNAVNGVATFSGLTLTTVTSFNQLSFSASGIQGVSTSSITVTAAVATQLAVVSPVGPFLAGSPFSITVDAKDANGNVATTYGGVVTLALLNNPGGATLGGTLTATASNGVATFSGLTLGVPAVGYTVQVSAAGLTAGVSPGFTVQNQLVVTSQPPATATAGVSFTVAASVEDGPGNVVASYNGPVTVANAFGGPLGGTTTVNAVNGVATFSGLTLTTVTGLNQLSFSASGIRGASSNVFSVAAAVATQLAVPSIPGPLLVGAPFQVTVNARDANGNLATGYSGLVTLALLNNPSGATLGGTLTATAANGVATFSGVSVSAPGIGYTVQATAAGLTAGASPAFNVQDQLVVTAQPPATITAGVPFTVAASVEDGLGRVITAYNGPVTVADKLGGALSGTTTVNAVGGVATFSGLTITRASSLDGLTFNASGIRGASTNGFSVAAAAAAQLVVTPVSVLPLAGVPFSVTVDAEDAYGNLATTYNGSVTLALMTNPGGATLGGTTTSNAVNGVATFNVSLGAAGAGYTLQATAAGLTAGVSSPFDVEDQLVVTAQPPATIIAGAPFTVAVAVEDGLGNIITSYNGPVTVADDSGFTLAGAPTVNAVAGIATFTGLTLSTAAGVDRLIFSATGIREARTNDFGVAAAVASRLSIAPLSGPFLAGAPFGVTVDAEDLNGNLATTYGGVVTLALLGNPGGTTLVGTLTATAVNGVATFSGLALGAPGVGYTVKATAAGLTAGVSPAFTVQDRLVVTAQPPATVTAGVPFTVAVTVEDGLGQVVTAYNGPVAVSDGNDGRLGGLTTVSAVGGVATFSGLILTHATSGDQLSFRASGTPGATTNGFSVAAAPASQLAVAPPGGPFVVNAPFQVTVDAEDAYGNRVTTYTGGVTLDLAGNPVGGTLGGTTTVSAVGGIAVFPGVTLSVPGAGYSLRATAAGLTAGISSAFTVEDELVVTAQPPAVVTAGAPFTVAVTVEDGLGHVITSYNGPVSVAGGSDLGGTTTVSAVGGVATFTGLTLTRADDGETLTFSAPMLVGASSGVFRVAAAAATRLVPEPLPGPYLVGLPFGVAVDAVDAFGNVATTYGGVVTLALLGNPGGATLGGTLTATAANGVATFTGVTLGAPGVGYTLRATAAGLTAGVSSSFTVQDQLVITSRPSGIVVAGALFALSATVEDGLGNVITSYNGPVTVADSHGRPLAGTTTVNAVGGVASFAGLSSTLAGVRTLVVGASGLRSASVDVAVSAASATHLVFAGPNGKGPDNVVPSPFSIEVAAEDAYGNIASSFGGTVSVTLSTNPTGATLGGPLTAKAINGVADINGLTVDRPGTGYMLQATAAGLPGAFSPAFGRTDQLVVTTAPPASVAAGESFGLVVEAQISAGVTDTSFNGDVTLELNSFTGGFLDAIQGTLTVAAVDGVATFSGLSVGQAGSDGFAISAAGLANAFTLFKVTGAVPSRLVVTTPPPASVTAGAPFGLTVAVEDSLGNVVPGYFGTVTLALANNPGGATLGGTLTANVSQGIATFSGLTLGAAGTGYTLAAATPGLDAAASPAFDVTAPGVANRLVVTTQPPAAVAAGTPLTVAAAVQDGLGNLVSSYNGPVSIADADGNPIGGTTTVNAVAGLATFAGLTLTRADANDALIVTAAGLGSATTAPLTITAAAATRLVVSAPAAAVLAGAPFGVTVEAVDPYGNVDPGYFSGSVALALGNNPGGAALGGPATATAVAGVATFDGLTLSAPGSGYTLAATAGGLPAGASTPFDVTRDVLVVTAAPVAGAAGSPFGLVVTAEDGSGHVDASFTGAVTLALVSLSGGTANLGGTTTVSATGGVATFSNVTIDQPGTYALLATANQIGSGVSGPVAMTPTPLATTTLALSGTGTFGGTGTLTATLASNGVPLAGKTVTFSLNEGGTFTDVGTATTDAGGVATLGGVSLAGVPAGVGAGLVAARFAGDATSAPSSTSGTLVVSRATPMVTWASPAAITFGTALGPAQLDATASVPGTFTYSPAAGTKLGAGIGQTLSVTFTPTDSANYTSVTAATTIDVLKATPAVTWANPAAITYGTALSSTQLDATASVPGTLVYTPAAGTVLHAGAGQALQVTFTPTDAADYNPASAAVVINVVPAAPSFDSLAAPTITYGTATAIISGHLSAGVLIPPGTVDITLAGAHVSAPIDPATGRFSAAVPTAALGASASAYAIDVSYPASNDFAAAAASTGITVNRADQTIHWLPPADIVYGTPLGPAQLDATVSVAGPDPTAGALSYSPVAGTILHAGPGQALTVSAAATANYNAASLSVAINVLKAVPTLTWSDPADIIYGNALGAAQLDATASVPGSFAYTPAAGTLLHAGSGQTLSATFTPTDTTDYAAGAATAAINVLKAAPALSWPQPADITYGTPLSGTQLDAGASFGGTAHAGDFIYTPAKGTLLHAGAGQTLSVTFSPGDAVDFSPASTTTLINVGQAVPAFDSLSAPTITAGPGSTTLSGRLGAGPAIPPGNVAVTLNGATTSAAIDPATGRFSAVFANSGLVPAGSPYVVAYAYAGSNDFAAAGASTHLTVRNPQDQNDYNGDGIADLATYHPATSTWTVQNLYSKGHAFGRANHDIAVPGDYLGNGKTEIATYRPSTAQWFIPGLYPKGIVFGARNIDIPVPGDYYGNGKTVIATYRPTTAQWFIAGQAKPIKFGKPKVDIPAPADYYHDGQTVIATYRPGSPGAWYISGMPKPVLFGGRNDVPVPGDYFGAGHAWLATYRPATAQWSLAGIGTYTFGSPGRDIPAPGDYLGLGHFEVAVYRPDTGQWFIGGQSRPVKFGGPGGIPASAPYQYQVLGGGAIKVRSVGAAPVTPPVAVSKIVLGLASPATTVNHPAPRRIRPSTPVPRHPDAFVSIAQFRSRRPPVASYVKEPGRAREASR